MLYSPCPPDPLPPITCNERMCRMARKTGSVNHTHMYFKRPDGLWACAGIEDCTHFMPKNMAPAPAGRMSLCWSCQKKFQLAPYNMEIDKPMCDECIERMDIIGEVLEEKGLFKKPEGLAAFGAKHYKTLLERPPVEEDKIEVIEEDEQHAPDCAIYEGGECTCQ
jgi:hypothetical protein